MNIARYSISDLEKLTGIKAHTIRIWEKRYGVIIPDRTDTNIRFYSAFDLQRLMNIAFLNKHGYKISQISGLNIDEIQEEVSRICELPGADEGYLADLLKATIDLDEDRFERNLNGSILKLGFDLSFQQLVFPLLDKINLLWQIGKISACQERFVNNLVKHKLVVAIDGMAGNVQSSSQHFLLYLPFGHYDEINLLYANYLLRKAGHHVIYLGPSIPLEHLQSLGNKQVIDNILVTINQGFTEKELITYSEKLIQVFPEKKIFLVSIGLDLNVNLPEMIQRIPTYPTLSQVFTA
jgi:DNA-binding transcriptional MerR regulator